jgi:hypothetical protein
MESHREGSKTAAARPTAMIIAKVAPTAGPGSGDHRSSEKATPNAASTARGARRESPAMNLQTSETCMFKPSEENAHVL